MRLSGYRLPVTVLPLLIHYKFIFPVGFADTVKNICTGSDWKLCCTVRLVPGSIYFQINNPGQVAVP